MKIRNPRSGQTIILSEAEQGSYLRSINLIAEDLVGLINFDKYYSLLVEADLPRLIKYHRVNGLNSKSVLQSSLTINVPESELESSVPISVRINFKDIGELFDETYPSVDYAYFDAKIIVKTNSIESVWEIPMDMVHREEIVLKHGDPKFDCFLVQRFSS